MAFMTGSHKLEELRNEGLGLDCSRKPLIHCIREKMENLKEIAKTGDVVAQYRLGLMYYHGVGVEQNFEKALEWLQKAAE